jgi:purine-nucleoside phosphorylase
MIDLDFKYKDLISFIEKSTLFEPDIAIILGSGLGEFAQSVEIKKTFSTSSLPSYPVSTIQGHSGKNHLSEFEGKKLLLFQGRIHVYEMQENSYYKRGRKCQSQFAPCRPDACHFF